MVVIRGVIAEWGSPAPWRADKMPRGYVVWAGIELTGNPMPKSTAEMLKALEKLIDEYLAFQRSRPDLPQGSWHDLSQDELELLVAAFQLHKSEQQGRKTD